MDTRVTNKHVLIVSDQIVVDQFFPSARIETPHQVQVFDTEEDKITYIAGMQSGMFPTIPAVGEPCEANTIYAYDTDKAKCLQSHNRMHYPIEQTPALWLVIPTVQGYPVWVQPTGVHDAYNIGDRVHFPAADSPVYESKINANVWSPTEYPAGWQLI